jgi:hypothetical protein
MNESETQKRAQIPIYVGVGEALTTIYVGWRRVTEPLTERTEELKTIPLYMWVRDSQTTIYGGCPGIARKTGIVTQKGCFWPKTAHRERQGDTLQAGGARILMEV